MDYVAQFEPYAHQFLEWIGFGTVVGLMAKAVMPGRDPGGAIATLAIGIFGTIMGCGIVAYFFNGEILTPISLPGFFIGTGGAFVLLFFYKLLGGYWFRETEGPVSVVDGGRRRRRRRRRSEYAGSYDD
jgi:uncharacterized membrane protein YeaQ/YmgE (transglycosylase-associated protein family)